MADTGSTGGGAAATIPQPLIIQVGDGTSGVPIKKGRDAFICDLAATLFSAMNFSTEPGSIREKAETCKCRALVMADVLEAYLYTDNQ